MRTIAWLFGIRRLSVLNASAKLSSWRMATQALSVRTHRR